MATKPETADEIFDRLLAKKAKQDAAVKVTQAEVEQQAKFLLGWAKGKEIIQANAGSTFYKSGKWMCTMVPAMVQELLKQGFVRGTEQRFKVDKDTTQLLQDSKAKGKTK